MPKPGKLPSFSVILISFHSVDKRQKNDAAKEKTWETKEYKYSKAIIQNCLYCIACRGGIKRAHQSSDSKHSLPRYCAHKVKGMAPTLLFMRNFAVGQVLKAGVWNSQMTFTSFYLCYITHKLLDTFSLSPVVTAQRVVQSWSSWTLVYSLLWLEGQVLCECVSFSLSWRSWWGCSHLEPIWHK